MAAGLAALAVLLYVGVRMVPPYLDNIEFHEQMEQAVARAASADALRADLQNTAARLGIPLRDGDVRISQTGPALRADVMYVRRIDLGLYAVDLHFHPSAAR